MGQSYGGFEELLERSGKSFLRNLTEWRSQLFENVKGRLYLAEVTVISQARRRE